MCNQEYTPSLTDVINAGLSKAEALAQVAASTDFDTFIPEVINNYMWALSEVIRDVRTAWEKFSM